MRWALLGLGVLACTGATEAPPPEPVVPAPVTVLYAGRDGVLVRGAQGVEQVPVEDPAVLEGLAPGASVVLVRDPDGALLSTTATGEGTLPEGFVAGGYPLTGTVVTVQAERIVVDHDPVEGLMGAMAMPFSVSEEVHGWIRRGDVLEARVVPTGEGYWLVDVLRTGRESASITFDVEALEVGSVLPATTLSVARGPAITVGAGQGAPTVLTFLYTTCPDPAFCPALVARLQPLQAAMPAEARIVAVTIDPETDTMPVLQAYAKGVGAEEGRWLFAQPTTAELAKLAQQAGLSIHLETGRIVHDTRVLVLDADGRVLQRYDRVDFPLDEVVRALAGAAR